jgi:hypothetical protein
MNSPPPKKIALPPASSLDKEEENLRAAITATLDGKDEHPCQAVDEFADEFLLQPGAPRK